MKKHKHVVLNKIPFIKYYLSTITNVLLLKPLHLFDPLKYIGNKEQSQNQHFYQILLNIYKSITNKLRYS